MAGYKGSAVVRREKSPIPGEDAVIYTALPSVNILKIDKSGVITPTTISCAKMKQIGSSAPAVTAEKILKYQVSGGSVTNYTSQLTVLAAWSYIDFLLYDENGSTLLDTKRVVVVNDGTNGDNGATGATMRGPSEWAIGKPYLSGSVNERFIDMVHYVEKWYYCIQSHTSSASILPTNVAYWVESNVFDFVATKVLFAQQAVIENAVVRYLKTSDSAAAQRIECFSNIMSVFNAIGGLCLSVHGGAMSDTAETSTVDPTDGSFYPSSVMSGSGGSDIQTLATFDITAGNNVVSIPAITLDATAQGDTSAGGWCSIMVQLLLDDEIIDSIVVGNSVGHENNHDYKDVPAFSRTLSLGEHNLYMSYEYFYEFEAGNTEPLQVSAQAFFASSARLSVSYTYNFVELCGGGFRVKVASNMYVEFSFADNAMNIILRNGNYAVKIANNGFYKMVNGADWVSTTL